MPYRCFAVLTKTFGPIMTLRLSQVSNIVVTSLEIAREVFQKNDLIFSSRSVPDAIRALSIHEKSLVRLPGNQRWRNLHKICTTGLFTSRSLNSTKSLQSQKVRELIAYVSECCASQMAVDIRYVSSTTILNLLSNTLFSTDFATLSSESKLEFVILT